MKEAMHRLIGILGAFLVAIGIFLAIEGSPHFYTTFIVGFWFLFDYIDYALRKDSIISFLMEKTHHYLIFFLLILNTAFAFVIDFVYGVQLTGMWDWPAYTSIWHWIRMYAVMTLAFALAVYELFCVIMYLLHARIGNRKHHPFVRQAYKIGVVFLFTPLLTPFIGTWIGPYVMLLAFIGIWFIVDSLSAYFHGNTVLDDILSGNVIVICALLLTVLISVFTQETLNVFSREWVYTELPLHVYLFGFPIIVIIGWIPLVAFCISTVYLVRAVGRR